VSVLNALDEARFGAARTLNLRESLPTAAQAVMRTEAWLRERQVSKAGEVLIITGRGNNSEGGVSVVRTEVFRLLALLRKKNVVSEITEHTPGSFIVRLAPINALFEAPRRRRSGPHRAMSEPASLQGLERETRALLRILALRTLDALGVRAESEKIVEHEILRLFSDLSATIADGPNREDELCAAIELALEELDDR
jgi:hypothetical protein